MNTDPWCTPGGQATADDNPDVKADCSDAQPAVIAQALDKVLAALGVDPGLKLTDLNGAGVLDWTDNGVATIKGSGLGSAISLGGEATANAHDYLSAALAYGFGSPSSAKADASFGSIASAVTLGGAVDATSLPLGFAFSTNADDPDAGTSASTTAFGGFAKATNVGDSMAFFFPDTGAKTVRSALYADAKITSTDSDTGATKNVSSCTSVAFIFQQSQEGDGPVVYAIKNPLDLGLDSILTKDDADGFGTLAGAFGAPDAISKILKVKLIPEFESDIVRISFQNGTPKIETDIPEWLGGPFGGQKSNDGAATQASAFTSAMGLRMVGSSPAAAEVTSSVLPAPATSATSDSPSSALTSNGPVSAPATSAPAPAIDSSPAVPAPSAPAPAPVESAPAVTPAPAPVEPAPAVEAPAPAVSAPSAPVIEAPSAPAPAATSDAPAVSLSTE
ncbi:MAG: hypothetical protein QM774_09695 [Gordonia sp. (in: high G+C Gram-positive bacteria)]|uniref:hypothetical protein n=1 Tax=Gordonia sp. (in: high G+C Gram-positive bacteria) TaxID=84139 RepID=UPI0039E249CD